MNAKEEFLRTIQGEARVKCAIVEYNIYWNDKAVILLKSEYSESDYKEFLNQLNFQYDSGFGGQELFGTIWLEDGTWYTRGEYDGSEWWEHHKLPEIPIELE